MAAVASLDLAHATLRAPRRSLLSRPHTSWPCLRPHCGDPHSASAAFAAPTWRRPSASVALRAAASRGQSQSESGEAASSSTSSSTPSPRPGKRVLTNEERLALGLQPLKGQASPAEAQAPARPLPTSSSSSTSRNGPSQGAPSRKNWTLLDQMDADGFGYMAPDDNEWAIIRTARRWGEWLKQATGEDDEAKSAAMGAGIMKVLLLVVFPTWLLLVLVAAGRLDLPPALAELQETLRS